MPYPYSPPWFLQGQTVDDIHARMMDALPPDIDASEGQIPWDFTRPAALAKAEFAGFDLNEAIRLVFPQWAYGEWLDLHAEMAGVRRREANRAFGAVGVAGVPGTVIAKGAQFATPAGISPSVLFEATEDAVLGGATDDRGRASAEVSVRAIVGGMGGNVPADAVKLMVRPISGVARLSNPAPITGGADAEGDDSLRGRILDALRLGSSFVGNSADYVRWAKEVPGVGDAVCVPEAFGPGTVELIVVDADGAPANRQILDAVRLHVMGADAADLGRLAPVGASLTVSAPAGAEIFISASVELGEGENAEAVTDRFKANLAPYWSGLAKETRDGDGAVYVRLVMVGAILANTDGVSDYGGLLVNGGTANIPVARGQYPVTGAVSLEVAV